MTVTEELVTIQLGTIQIALPEPLAGPWRELAANPGRDLTASHPNTTWVFRGAQPGRHIHRGYLTTCLSKLFSTRAARLGTLHELTNSHPWPSSRKRSATHPPPSNAAPPTQQPPTPDTALQPEKRGRRRDTNKSHHGAHSTTRTCGARVQPVGYRTMRTSTKAGIASSGSSVPSAAKPLRR